MIIFALIFRESIDGSRSIRTRRRLTTGIHTDYNDDNDDDIDDDDSENDTVVVVVIVVVVVVVDDDYDDDDDDDDDTENDTIDEDDDDDDDDDSESDKLITGGIDNVLWFKIKILLFISVVGLLIICKLVLVVFVIVELLDDDSDVAGLRALSSIAEWIASVVEDLK